jgi:hypothetical protein
VSDWKGDVTAQDSVTLQVAGALVTNGIPYLLSGSFASSFWGIPRSTNDADFVIQMSGGIGLDFVRGLGENFELDPQLSFETVTGTYRQFVYHRKTAFKVEVFLLSQDPHDQERFARRREADLFGQRIWLLSPEDSIISKLRWYRPKDQDDIRNIISVQASKLDWPYIEKWGREHRTLALLDQIKRTVADI